MLKKRFLSSLCSMFVLGSCLTSHPLAACTDFLIKSQDNASIVGRSMEFGQLLPTQLQIFPRGQRFQSITPNDQPGMAWSNQYAYAGMIFKPANVLMDGFNEQGLSIGALWLPGTQYPELPSSATPETTLFFADVTSWILSNFATIDETIAALPKANIYAGKVPGFSAIPPIHLALHDATGKSAVIEFTNGKMQIFNNPIGVLTNAPEFPWHITNLRNYLNLRALNAGPITINGTVLEPLGQGTGLLGIPGDWSPPSRFVRTTVLKQALVTPKNADGAVLAAIHLLNTVDIPYGIIRSGSTPQGDNFDYTQWIIVKDLTNKKLYYRTYGNQNIETVDLKNNFSEPKVVELTTITP